MRLRWVAEIAVQAWLPSRWIQSDDGQGPTAHRQYLAASRFPDHRTRFRMSFGDRSFAAVQSLSFSVWFFYRFPLSFGGRGRGERTLPSFMKTKLSGR